MRRLPLAAALVAVVGALPLPVASAHAPGAVFRAAPAACSAGHVALTFDDGPSPTVTARLLGTLKRLRAPATFFMVGERVAASPATARLVERSGFLVANHTYRHEDLQRLNREQIIATIRSTSDALTDAGLHPTDLMRPPYGAVDPHVYAAIRATRLQPVLWTVDPRDWESGDAAQIAARVLGQLHPGNEIVLQHDGVTNSPSSIAAVPRIVHEARRRGFCFTGLDEHGRPGFPSPAASVSVTPRDRHVVEGRTLHVTITLASEAGRDTSLRLLLRARDASLGEDLTRPRSTVRFPAGTLEQQVEIPIAADDLPEGRERFELRIASGEGVRPLRGRITIVIEDRES